MGEFAASHNHLIDSHEKMVIDIDNIKAKLIDLEDRFRRNNIKFKGIPEYISPSALTAYVQAILKQLLPTSSAMDFTIDRAHRIPRPRHLPETAPRDTLAHIYFYHI